MEVCEGVGVVEVVPPLLTGDQERAFTPARCPRRVRMCLNSVLVVAWVSGSCFMADDGREGFEGTE